MTDPQVVGKVFFFFNIDGKELGIGKIFGYAMDHTFEQDALSGPFGGKDDHNRVPISIRNNPIEFSSTDLMICIVRTQCPIRIFGESLGKTGDE